MFNYKNLLNFFQSAPWGGRAAPTIPAKKFDLDPFVGGIGFVLARRLFRSE